MCRLSCPHRAPGGETTAKRGPTTTPNLSWLTKLGACGHGKSRDTAGTKKRNVSLHCFPCAHCGPGRAAAGVHGQGAFWRWRRVLERSLGNLREGFCQQQAGPVHYIFAVGGSSPTATADATPPLQPCLKKNVHPSRQDVPGFLCVFAASWPLQCVRRCALNPPCRHHISYGLCPPIAQTQLRLMINPMLDSMLDSMLDAMLDSMPDSMLDPMRGTMLDSMPDSTRDSTLDSTLNSMPCSMLDSQSPIP